MKTIVLKYAIRHSGRWFFGARHFDLCCFILSLNNFSHFGKKNLKRRQNNNCSFFYCSFINILTLLLFLFYVIQSYILYLFFSNFVLHLPFLFYFFILFYI